METLTMKTKVAVLAVALSLSGCGSTLKQVRGYEGEPQAAEKVALMLPTAYVTIHSIDALTGLAFTPSGRGTGFSNTTYEIEMTAGTHEVEVSYYDGMSYSNRGKISIEISPGRRYILRAATKGREWHPTLVDVTDRPECWKTSVGTLVGPKGCE